MEHRTRTPRSVALVNADASGHELPALLLADYADALAAYSKLGGTQMPDLVDDPTKADATVVAWHWNGNSIFLPDLSDKRDYAIVCCDGADESTARRAHSYSGDDVIGSGNSWAGTLVIMGAEKLVEHMGCPRMGRRRRYASEAIDDLVLALRCGKEFSDVAAFPHRTIELFY